MILGFQKFDVAFLPLMYMFVGFKLLFFIVLFGDFKVGILGAFAQVTVNIAT